MTKKYFCEFCQVHIQNNVQIRKKHDEGLIHQQKKAEHYKRYKTPQEILTEEEGKQTCSRYFNNQCKFGAFCRFSHYTKEELIEMRIQVTREKMEKESVKPILQTVEDYFEYKRQQNSELELPPSLRKRTKVIEILEDWG